MNWCCAMSPVHLHINRLYFKAASVDILAHNKLYLMQTKKASGFIHSSIITLLTCQSSCLQELLRPAAATHLYYEPGLQWNKNTRLTEFLILLFICATNLLVELASSAASQRRWSALKKLLCSTTKWRVLTTKISQIWTDHIQHSDRTAINNGYTLSCLFTQRSLIIWMQIVIKLMKFLTNNISPLWEKRIHLHAFFIVLCPCYVILCC